MTYLLILGQAVRGERSLQGDVACQGSAGRRGGSSSQTGVDGAPLCCGPPRTAALVRCRRLSRRTGTGAPSTGSAHCGEKCRQPEMGILGTELGGVRAADDPAAGSSRACKGLKPFCTFSCICHHGDLEFRRQGFVSLRALSS